MIKFTVITITYNAEHVFQRTADSVLRQSYPHLEHIIIDGASTDKTVDMAKDYIQRSEKTGHKTTLVSEPDNGLYDAMNKGLAKATGDYVVFMNAGDCFPSADTLRTIAGNPVITDMQEKGKPLPAVLYGDTDIVDDNGKFLFRRRNAFPEHLTWRSFRKGMLVCHQAFYARTDISRNITYDTHYRYSADVDWCIRVMKEAEHLGLPLVNLHTTTANYLREGQSTIHHRASLTERFNIMSRHYGLMRTVMTHIWFIIRAVLRLRK